MIKIKKSVQRVGSMLGFCRDCAFRYAFRGKVPSKMKTTLMADFRNQDQYDLLVLQSGFQERRIPDDATGSFLVGRENNVGDLFCCGLDSWSSIGNTPIARSNSTTRKALSLFPQSRRSHIQEISSAKSNGFNLNKGIQMIRSESS